ncbi:protein VTE6, chloroplastic [Elaeis guineensis]|uniref:Protein VTE6, chloroplastic n=1 Tax=Elaeis guineensis var. tenera TaxID=51953 RepID=A0A6I9QWA0_ELAGV|nr:protein VTE6, chloroplastic [Elaeis guineensis]XP_010916363.1 protein VTE6, chloroplastic [Elaeis guineensis]XP_029120124.1 protein VTE6, chloroplastic [Elaeis guineensis]
MAYTLLLPLSRPPLSAPPLRRLSVPNSLPLFSVPKTLVLNPRSRVPRMLSPPRAFSFQELAGLQNSLLDLLRASPPTWKSAIASNLLIFLVGSPILVSGLSTSGIGAAFLLGALTWRAFGWPGFLLVAAYFVVGTVATKLKITQKEALGVAEKRRGRRGPGSVIGSSAAGCVCAFLSICGIGGRSFAGLWQLGFVASFCTKLSDTVSSEIGKAYGKTAYLVTTFKVVPRGTEGAVSVEGTIAGFLASILLASIGYFLREIDVPQAAICVLASQIANFGESLIGAALQDKEGFRWLNNDAVNVINISIGSILAVLMQQFMLQS